MFETGKKNKLVLFAGAFIAGIAGLFAFFGTGQETSQPIRTVACVNPEKGEQLAQAQEEQINCLFVSCSGFL